MYVCILPGILRMRLFYPGGENKSTTILPVWSLRMRDLILFSLLLPFFSAFMEWHTRCSNTFRVHADQWSIFIHNYILTKASIRPIIIAHYTPTWWLCRSTNVRIYDCGCVLWLFIAFGCMIHRLAHHNNWADSYMILAINVKSLYL